MEGSTSSTPGLGWGYSVRGPYLAMLLCTPAQYAASACQQYTCCTCTRRGRFRGQRPGWKAQGLGYGRLCMRADC